MVRRGRRYASDRPVQALCDPKSRRHHTKLWELEEGSFPFGPEVTLTDEGMRHVSWLGVVKGVFIYGVPITDAGLRWLKGLKKLKSVRLERTQVTALGVAELQKALPTCEVEWHPAAAKARTAMNSK